MSNFDKRLLQLIAEERFCGKVPLFDDTSDIRLFQLTDVDNTARMPFKEIAIKVYNTALDEFVKHADTIIQSKNRVLYSYELDMIGEQLKMKVRI